MVVATPSTVEVERYSLSTPPAGNVFAMPSTFHSVSRPWMTSGADLTAL